jgi:hypothetical protein
MKHEFVRPKNVLLVLALVWIVAGCARSDQGSSGQTAESLTFATPDEAVTALATAAEKHDVPELRRLFGPGTDDLLSSGDEVEDRRGREAFLQRYQASHQLVSGGSADLVVLQVGEDNWPLPIPLVRKNGRWYFDGAAGADELVRMRIGGNELRTIDVMYGYVAAQQEYAAKGHDGVPAGVYAQRLRSDPGKHNGLYWEVAASEPESPAGPALARATAEGYAKDGQQQGDRRPYHGYLYRPLLSQGPAATGGARDYVVNGKLTRGFAVIAYPADYGASGITTFIVNQDGLVWQRDLGENTEMEAAAITQFNPDSSWTPIPPEE